MGKVGEVIAGSASLSTMYAQRLLSGIEAEKFGSFARPGGAVLRSNHPAFVFGHLCMYPAKAMKMLGVSAEAFEPPSNYAALFDAGVECKDDPENRIYPRMSELTDRYFSSYSALHQALRAAPDDLLLGPNPSEGRMREVFPTLGAVMGFYVTGHPQMHLGQISAWRRAMGLPPA